jgi:hypothetical protein
MTNLVLLYTGNVGSTPLVQLAGQHPQILVPVYEQFDHYQVVREHPDTDPFDLLSDAMGKMLKREMSPFFESPKIKSILGRDDFPSREEAPHVVFKWRGAKFNPELPGGEKLLEVFHKNDVRGLVLARRSVVEQAVKIHLSEKVYGGRHQQFKAEALSDAEYEAYLEEQRRLAIEIDDEDLDVCRKLADQFLGRTLASIETAHAYFGRNHPPQLLITEQFLRPELDFDAWSRALTAMLGDTIQISPEMQPSVRKGGLDLRNCANPDRLARDPGLRKIEKRYQAALRSLPLVLGTHSRARLTDRLSPSIYAPPIAFGSLTTA